LSLGQLKARSGLQHRSIKAIQEALEDDRFCQLNQLLQCAGIGDKTLEKVYRFVLQEKEPPSPSQGALF